MDYIKMNVINAPSSNFKYIVTPSPDSDSIYAYKNFLFNNDVNTVLRLCEEKKYDDTILTASNIKVIDMPLKDGTSPNEETIKKWINILNEEKNGIAVHCNAGLGRAPLFVCVGLIKIQNMDEYDAIDLIRNNIKGSLNNNQLNFICNKLKNMKLHEKKSNCVIS